MANGSTAINREQHTLGRQFGEQDVEVIQKKPLYTGFFRMEAWTLRHRRFAGDWMPPFTREIFVRGEATCVLPYDAKNDRVVLVEQFRVGAIGQHQSPWLLELVAGINEAGETPEAVARREAVEEAALTLQEIEVICNYWVSPGGTSERIHLLCAQVDSTGAGGIHGLADEHEDIRVHVFTAEEAIAMVSRGVVNNAASIIALQWLQLNRERLRAKWGTGDQTTDD